MGASGGGGGLREGLGAGRAWGGVLGVGDGAPGRGGPGRGMAAAGGVEGVAAGLAPEPQAGCGDRTGMVGWRGPGMYWGGIAPGGVVGGREPGGAAGAAEGRGAGVGDGATDGVRGPPPAGTRAPGGAEYPGREGDAAAGGCDGMARGGALIGRDDGIGAVGECASAGLGLACGTNGCCGGGASMVGRSSTSSFGSLLVTAGLGGGDEPRRFFALQVGHRMGPRMVNGGRGICVPQPLQSIATRALYRIAAGP